MILVPPYKKRTHEFLHKKLLFCQNLLQMRDWQLELITENYPPSIFLDSDNGQSVSRCWFDDSILKGAIWISPLRAKEQGIDPLWLLYHEIGHLFGILHNEETRCNILASLLAKIQED